jgi:hypothetical protein
MRTPLIAGAVVGLGLWLAPIASSEPAPPEPPDPCVKGFCQPPADRHPDINSGVHEPPPPPSRLPQSGGDGANPPPGFPVPGPGGPVPAPGGPSERHQDPVGGNGGPPGPPPPPPPRGE